MTNLTETLARKFIVIDGPDGSGKSTQLHLLASHLRREGLSVTETKDPGGTVIGDKIREILLHTDHTDMTIGCEMLLYMASRTQLAGEVIAPAAAKGHCVLCDRWVSSTVAYQVAEGRLEAAEIMDVYRIALQDMRPDLTIILDLPAEAGLGRIDGRMDRIEAKGLEFHQKVRQLFLQQAAATPGLFTVIDAGGSEREVHQRLMGCLENWEFAD